MTCGVYEFWCGPHFYQGSSKNIENRWKQHLKSLEAGRHRNPKVQSAYDKYGWTDAGVLVECEEHTLIAWEQAYIDTNWGDEKFLNLSATADRPAGMKGKSVPAITRAKISAAFKGVPKSAEHRAKIGAAHKGKTLSDDHRAKLTGKPLSEERRAKISAAKKGKTLSDDHRAKMSDAHKGKTHSDESRAKMSALHKERWARRKSIDLFGMDFA